jgi:RNA polymerase sigma factor (sigma-70 family)
MAARWDFAAGAEANRREAQNDRAGDLKQKVEQVQLLMEEIRQEISHFVLTRIHRLVDLDPGERDVLIEFVHRKIWDSLCTYNHGKGVSFMTWLHSVVDSAIVDNLRRGRRVPAVPIDDNLVADEKQEPAAEHERRAESAAVREVLSRLSSPQRREILLLMVTFSNMTYEDIVCMMHLSSVEDARQLKHRALGEARRILANMGLGPDAFTSLFR